MKVRLKNIIGFLSLLTLVIIYRTAFLENYLGFSSSSSQFVLFPFVLFCVFILTFWQKVIPRYALFLAAIAGITLGAASMGVRPERADALKVYFSPFISDPHESQSIKFSNLLQKLLDKLNVDSDIERVSNPLTNLAKVNDFIKKRLLENPNEAAFVISGSPRWMALSVSPKISSHVLDDELSEISSALNIKLVTDVSGTGLSDGFSPATQDYISRLIAAFSSFNEGNIDQAEIYLAEAASITEHWSSVTHRAYALWLLGTLYINKAFNGDTIEPAYLLCAIDYLNRSRGFIKRNPNPELLSAVLNNRGVAHFLSYLYFGKKTLRKQALREFQFASKASFKSGSAIDRPAWLVARENLFSLNRPKDLKKIFAQKVRRNQKKQGILATKAKNHKVAVEKKAK